MSDSFPNNEPDELAEVDALVTQAARGSGDAFTAIVQLFEAEIQRFIARRMDVQLAKRLDASDIVQQTFLKAHRRLADFAERRPMPLRTWLIKTAMELLRDERVKHLKRERRAASREVALPQQTSVMLARRLATQTTASEFVMKREQQNAVARMIDRIKPAEREVLLLRHVDELRFDEIGNLLDINAAAARQRYARAIVSLRALCVENNIDSEIR